jgi:hypothetical protein
MKITEIDFNVITGKETVTERDETNAEKIYREKKEAELAAAITEAEVRAVAKKALLAKLGITAEEAKLLLS